MNGCWLAAQWIFFTLVVSFCIVLAFVGKSPVVLLVPVALFVMFLALGRVWAVLAYPVTTYNRLVGLRNQVDSMVGQVDVYLKRRYDLIPALAEAARGYSNFEADTLARLSELRARAESEVLSADERVDIENRVIGLLEKLLVVAENYPDLKASGPYMTLQRELLVQEEKISAARRTYNAMVTDYNNLVQTFPANVIAGVCGFRVRAWFSASPLETRLHNLEKEIA